MTQEEIKMKVLPIVGKYLSCNGESDYDLDASLKECYGADSLDIVQIVMDVEKDFSITITDEAADAIRTIRDIIDEVQRHILD